MKMPTISGIHNEDALVHRLVIILTDFKRCQSLCGDHVVYEFRPNTHWGWTPSDLPITCIRCAVADIPDLDR